MSSANTFSSLGPMYKEQYDNNPKKPKDKLKKLKDMLKKATNAK